jgi:hypothetical protein
MSLETEDPSNKPNNSITYVILTVVVLTGVIWLGVQWIEGEILNNKKAIGDAVSSIGDQVNATNSQPPKK